MNKDKNGTTSNIQSSSAGESSSGKTKSINVNLSPWPKKTKVGVLLDDNKYNDSVGIGVNPNTRHNTCQDINQPSQFAESMANLTTGRRLSLSASTNSTRKSFLGEIKSRLSFNKKQEGLPGEPSSSQQQQQDENSSIPCDRVLVVKEFEKENKKLALPLQGRRKQVFQKQENGSDNGNASNLPSFTTVNKLQMSLKKWKIKKNTEAVRDTIAVNKHHQKLLDECADSLQTEIPFPLHNIMKEESLLILNRVHQMYKSLLGSKHKLTKEAEKQIIYLRQSKYVPDVKTSP